MKKIIKGVIILVIGGVTYSFTQTDVARNMSKDTGMTEQQATKFIENIPEEDFKSWTEIGKGYVLVGKELIDAMAEIDCNKWEFDWESPTLSCQQGLNQMSIFALSSIDLGNSYIKLDSSNATEIDIRKTITLIGSYNANLALEIIANILTQEEIAEERNINSYNKAVLQSAIDN